MLNLSKPLKQNQKVLNIKENLTNEVKCLADYRLNQKFTSDVCNTVETKIKKKYKVNKKQLVLDILRVGHDLNEEELKVIENQIDYLFLEGLIKGIPVIKKWVVGGLSLLGIHVNLLSQTSTVSSSNKQ